MTTTSWYCDNRATLHGIRLGILFSAEAPIDVSQVLESDNQSFDYMLIDYDHLSLDELIYKFLSSEGVEFRVG